MTNNTQDTTPDHAVSEQHSEETIDTILKEAKLTENGTHLSLVGKGLDHIPREIHGKFGSYIVSLDLSWNDISKIENIERFTRLQSLVLDNNSIESLASITDESGSSMSKQCTQHLETLWLNNNRLMDLDEVLDVLADKSRFPRLSYLSLLKNPCCPNEFTGGDTDDYQRYRYYVLWRLKGLKFLDSRQVTPEERREAEKRGQFCKVAKPDYEKLQQEQQQHQAAGQEQDIAHTAVSERSSADKSGTQSFFGYTKHVYTGRHSEGNRFIKNSDL